MGSLGSLALAGGDDELVALPKADLHVHLVGSAAPQTVTRLAARHPQVGVPADHAELESLFLFRDFEHFCTVYGLVSELIRDPGDVVELAVGLAADLRSQGAGYAEVTVTPTTHLAAGFTADELAQALDRGARRALREHGIELAWVYDINGFEGVPGGWRTLDCAVHHGPAGLVGFGIGGVEARAPRALFGDVFAAARAAGLHSVPHAGEGAGPGEVWAALDHLGAERIGHGIAAAADPRLCQRLQDDGVTLEVCPSSNVATGVVGAFADHPLPALLDAGVPVVLASDDPPMFGTSLIEEYRRARDVLGLTTAALRRMAAASIEASFASTGAEAAAALGR